MRVSQTAAAVMVAAGMGIAVPGAAVAQEPAVPPQAEEQVEVTQELLERFVAVYPAVVNVAVAAQNEMATAETAEEAQSIQADAQTRVAELLMEGEITPVEYEAVVMELNDDPALMAEFERLLEEERDEEGGGL